MSFQQGRASRVYRPRLPATWWLRNWKYFLFMLREVSSVFIAVLVVIYMVGIYRFTQGRNSYEAYLDTLQTPLSGTLFVVIFLFSLYHSFTWFQSAGKVMVVRLGGRTVPSLLVLLANCLAWALVSGAIFYLMVAV